MMPETDAFEFVEAIRQRDEARHLPVIVLTADLDGEEYHRLGGSIEGVLRNSLGGREEVLSIIGKVIAERLQLGAAIHLERI
jgi:CheY-like chemotaxis protein